MSPQTWQRVKSLYTTALELPRHRRADYLRQQAAEEPRVLAEALRLIEFEDDAPSPRLDALQVPSGLLTNGKRGSLLPGQRLNDRYEIRRFIAAGGFGEVYEADDTERGERIALKLFRPEFATADHVSWLRREVQLARRIQHPNICRVFDFVQNTQASFLTMELLEGETLASYLRREGALSERRALPLIRQIVAALAAAHASGVIHRDLKPGNIMLVPRPDGPLRLVVTDFGLARQSSLDRRTTVSAQSSTAAFGTPAYMAPEQIAGRPPGPPADIYSLGVVLHEMLTGELPFAGDSPLALAVRKTRETPASPLHLAPALRPAWERCILRCLEPNPANRFADVREILTYLDSRTNAALNWKLARRTLRPYAKWRNVAAAAAVLALSLTAWKLWPSTPSPADTTQWERGIFHLHAGEPLQAIRLWQQNPDAVPRTRADIALAWRQLQLPAETGKWLIAEPDRTYKKAVETWLAGDAPAAIALLKTRAATTPTNAEYLADLAHFETLQSGQPSPTWSKVTALRPDHPAAHLQLANLRAAANDHNATERSFLSAATYAQAHQLPELVKAISRRRGLYRLAAGHTDAARNDLATIAAQTFPEGTGAGPCEHKLILQAGVQDDFAAPPDPVSFISPRFRQMTALANRPNSGRFDQEPRDTALAISFPLPPVRICSGQLLINMRRAPGSGADNDILLAGAAPFDSSTVPALQRPLWTGAPNRLKGGIQIELTPEVFANVQRAYAGEPQAFLDLFASDDTDFDYIVLVLVY